MNNLLINNPSKGPGARIYFCKVVRFMPSSNTVDCVTIDNNISLTSCSVACAMPAGFAYGSRYFPSHDDQNPESDYINSPGDLYCVAAFLENDFNNAAVLGFLFPMETTLSIAEHGLFIFRHESDVIWMVRSDGTMQIYHPSGSIIKIGDDDSNEIDSDREQGGLYPAKTDGLYLRKTADYNAQKESNLFINWYKGQKIKIDSLGNVVASTEDAAGAVVSSITMTPDGRITIYSADQVNVNTKDVNINASGDVVATIQGDVVANVQGNISANVAGNVSVSAGGITSVDTAGDATINAANASINATGAVGVVSDTIANITGNLGVNISSPNGPITVLAPSSYVLVGGTGVPGIAPTPWRYKFN